MEEEKTAKLVKPWAEAQGRGDPNTGPHLFNTPMTTTNMTGILTK